MGKYFKDLTEAFTSTFKGMSVTIKHFFSKPVTVQYPDEKLPISDAYLGKHLLEQEKCIACNQCIKLCPVECLYLEADRHPGKVLEWKSFTVNYNHCMFCGLCVTTCPTDALHMTKEYDLSVYDRSECLLELTSYQGLRPEDHEAIKAAKEKKKAAAAAKAKKAAEEKAAAEQADKTSEPPTDQGDENKEKPGKE